MASVKFNEVNSNKTKVETSILIDNKDERSLSTEETCTSSSLVKNENKFLCFNNFNYAYVVLIAAFIAYMLGSLLSSCFGVLFESMANDLKWSKSKVAFIGACLSSLDNVLGPVSSGLINCYGCRKTAIVGGLFASIGVIGSAYVNEFWLFSLLLGFISSFGSSLVLVSTVVVVTYYFEDKPSFASGFVISGASFGQSIFSLIIIQINEFYGRSGCFLILGGLLLNIIVCGALFKPLDWEKEGYEYDENDDEDEDAIEEEVVDDDDDEEYTDEKSKQNSIEISNEQSTDENNNNKMNNEENQIKVLKPKITFLNKIKKLLNIKSSNDNNNFIIKKNSILNDGINTKKLLDSPLPILSIDHHHSHHHHHHYHHHNHFNYLPHLVYRYPINLRNYYYRSLINLNSRLLAFHSHSPISISNQTLCEIKQIEMKFNDKLLSVSCPNLNNDEKQIQQPITDESNHTKLILTANDLRKYFDYTNQSKLQHNMKTNPRQQMITANPQINVVNEKVDINAINNEVENDELKINIYKKLRKVIYLKKIKNLFSRLFYSIKETLKLFTLVEFSIFALCNFILSLFYEVPFYFINSYMIENGFSHNKAGIVTVSVGIVCIFAAIFYGYIGDLKRINWIILYSFCLVLTGICNFAVPLCIQNYALTMICMIALGVFISVNDVMVPIICVNIVGYDDFVSAYGLIFFCQGIASLIGPPCLGMIVDYTGSYAYSYNISGIGMCLSGVILLVLLINNKCKRKNDKKVPKEQETC